MGESAFGSRGGQKPSESRMSVREWNTASETSKKTFLDYFGFDDINWELGFTDLPIEIQGQFELYLHNPARYPEPLFED